MNSYKLQLFLTLAKSLNFHRAAQQAHVSPSTLSRNIKELERELGLELFTRNNRSVSLTHQGKRLHEYASDALQSWDSFCEELRQESSLLRGSLSIFCSVTASYSFLHDILTQFRSEQPHIAITLHTGDPALATERVVAGNEDISIASKQDAMPYGLDFKKITDSKLTLISPLNPSFEIPESPTAQDWSLIPFIFSERGVTRDRLERWIANSNIKPTIYAQVAGHEAIVSMVSLGFGVGLVPEIVLENSPLANKVKTIESSGDFGPYEVGICVLTSRLNNPIIREFWRSIGAE